MPESSDPETFAVREVASYDDGAAAALTTLDAAVVAADGAGALDAAAHRQLRHRGLNGARLWLAERAGGPAGFALLVGDELALAVAPEQRRAGAGGALAAAALGGVGDSGKAVRAWSHADHPGAARLAGRFGLTRVRELLVMTRTTSELPAVPEQAGVRLRAYEADDERDLLAINAAAFADHPEQGAMDERDLAERMAEPWFTPHGLLIADDVASGRMLGFHWTKTERRPGDDVHPGDDAAPDGEVYVVGVSPDAQGRGLGRLLTLAGLHHLKSYGVRVIELYVEGDNAPARAVYEGLGFRVAATHAQYAR